MDKKCSDLTKILTPQRSSVNNTGLSPEACKALKKLKEELISSCLFSPNLSELFTIETDASDIALGGVLSQKGRPVAFYSRALHTNEKGSL